MWASACGIAPEVFFAMCDEELETGVWDKYPIHETSFNTSGSNSNEGTGRPETENPTEKTIQSRGNNGNNMPSPSDNK